MLYHLVLGSLLAAVAAQSSCHAAPDCTTCTSPTYGTCGWCAVNVTYPTKVGPQCVDIHETFDCNVQFQTDKCVQGWKCGGSANATQCVPSVGGIADKTACEKSCAKPPPKPPPPPPPPSPPKQAYTCDAKTWTCAKSKFGEPSMQTCQDHCKVSYQCDDAAQVCKEAAPNATGKHYYSNTTCASVCPAKPSPVPYEVRGIWRGLAIHNTYKAGEWVANITADFVSIWSPTASGYELYVRGNASSLVAPGSGTYIISVVSTAGKLKGTVKFLGGDYSMNPEVTGFLQLAVDESNIGQEVSDFDSAMLKATVISFETCPAGGASPPAPPPPPPAPGPPPPCQAKIDVVIILDGSASIAQADWQRALSFTNKLIDGFKISANDVEIGVVQFSSRAQQVIGLSADKAAITTAVSNLRQMQQNTNTYSGFALAKSILDTQGRSTAKGKLVILLTDGNQNQGSPAVTVSRALQAEGAQVFGIGVGSQIDEAELKSWCSAPLSSHYFTVTAFSALEQILKAIIASACPIPPVAALGAPLFVHATGRKLQAPAPPVHTGSKCKFHLPSGLPVTVSSRQLQMLTDAEARAELRTLNLLPVLSLTPEPVKVVEVVGFTPTHAHVGNGSDPCQVYSNCSSCIGAHSGGKSCGWCTGTIEGSTFQCAGHETGAPAFTCEGHYQTTTCEAPGDCGLKGVYRGLRIDNSYDFGEYTSTFGAGTTNTSESISIVSPSGSVVSGKISCAAKCDTGTALAGVPFKITTGTGSILNGICGYSTQVQAETTGLMLALSNAGVGTPPKDFDSAMNSTNATVYTYYTCSPFKTAECHFRAPTPP